MSRIGDVLAGVAYVALIMLLVRPGSNASTAVTSIGSALGVLFKTAADL